MPEGKLLTIIIPTRNRSSFLRRLLTYYCKLHLEGAVLIVDSSDLAHVSQNQRVVDFLEADLNVAYRVHDASASLSEKVCDSLNYVTTPYAVIGADDDFFVPSTLSRVVQFLEDHDEYIVAHGDAIGFITDSSEAYGQIRPTGRYNQRANENSTGGERLLNCIPLYPKGGTTWYSVQRTEQIRERWGKAVALELDDVFYELLLTALSAIQGKAKKLDGLYMARQRFPAKIYTEPFDWVAGPSWAAQYERFRDCLAEELVHQDSVTMDQARVVTKQALWLYLANELTRRGQRRYGGTAKNQMRETLRQVPGLVRSWRVIKNAFPKMLATEMSLPALLHRSSPYYADFQPIYRAVRSPPELP